MPYNIYCWEIIFHQTKQQTCVMLCINITVFFFMCCFVGHGQLSNLPNLSYGSIYMKLWHGLTTMDLDPHPCVRFMAHTVTNHIRDQVRFQLNFYLIVLCIRHCHTAWNGVIVVNENLYVHNSSLPIHCATILLKFFCP